MKFFKKKKSNFGASDNYHGTSVRISDALPDGVVEEEDADWLKDNNRYNPYVPYKPPPAEEPAEEEKIPQAELAIPKTEPVVETQKEKIPETEPVIETQTKMPETEPERIIETPKDFHVNLTMDTVSSHTDEKPLQEDAFPNNFFKENEQPSLYAPPPELEEKFQTDFFSDFQPVILDSPPAETPPTEVSQDKQKAMDEIDELVEEFNGQMGAPDSSDDDDSDDSDTDEEDLFGDLGDEYSGDDDMIGDLDESSSSDSDYSSSSDDEYTEDQEPPAKVAKTLARQEPPAKAATKLPVVQEEKKEAVAQEEKKEDEPVIAQPSSRDSSSKTGSPSRNASSKTGSPSRNASSKTGSPSRDASSKTGSPNRDASSKTGSSNRDASTGSKPDFDYVVDEEEEGENGGLFSGLSLKQMFWDDFEDEVDEDDVPSDEESDNGDGATGATGPDPIVDEEVKSQVGLEIAPSGEIENAESPIENEVLPKTTEEEATAIGDVRDSAKDTSKDTMEPQTDSQGLESMLEGTQGLVLLERFAGKVVVKQGEEQDPGKLNPNSTAVRKKNKPFKLSGFSGLKKSRTKKNAVASKTGAKLGRSSSKKVKATSAESKPTSAEPKPPTATDNAKTAAASPVQSDAPNSPPATKATSAESKPTAATDNVKTEAATTVEPVASKSPSATILKASGTDDEAKPAEPEAAQATAASSVVPEVQRTIDAPEKKGAETEEKQSEFAVFSSMIQDVYKFAFGNFPVSRKHSKEKSPKEIWAEPAVDRGFETCQSSVGGEPTIQKAISREYEQNAQVPSVLKELTADPVATPTKAGSGVGEIDTPATTPATSPATTPASSDGSLSRSVEEATGPETQKIEEGYEVRRGEAVVEIHEVASGKGFEFSQKIHTIFRTTKGKKKSKKVKQQKQKKSWFGRKKGTKTTKQ